MSQSEIPSLPFDANTVLRSYLYSAYPAGILSATRGIPFRALSYHTQLFFPASKLTARGRNRAHFRFFPGFGFEQFAALGCFRIATHEASTLGTAGGGEVVQITRRCLEKGHWVFVYLDEFFVPGTRPHATRHHRHPLLVVGCDESSGELLGVSYRSDDQLGEVRIPFRSFAEGVHSPAGRGKGRYHDFTVLKEIELADENDDRFEAEAYLDQLAGYHAGTNNAADYLRGAWSLPDQACIGHVYWDEPSTDGAFGLSVYRAWQEYITGVMATRSGVDMRATRVLMDHKELLTRGLELVFGPAGGLPREIAESCTELRRLGTAIHQNSFLWNRMKGEAIGRQILNAIETLAAKERALLESVLFRRGLVRNAGESLLRQAGATGARIDASAGLSS